MVQIETNSNPEQEQLAPTITFAELEEHQFKIPGGHSYELSNGDIRVVDRSFGRIGDTVTDINSAEDFEKLEHMIVAKMTGYWPPFSRKRSPTGANTTTVEDPLSWKLRPRAYHGDLTNGSAVVIPEPDAEGRGAGRKMTLLLMADTKVGPVQRAVTYRVFDKTRNVHRRFYADKVFNAAERAAEERAKLSARESYKVASNGVRKVFSAGLPGHGHR